MDKDILKQIEKDFDDVLTNVTQEALDMLQRFIEDEIYNAPEGKYYVRTGEFYNSFVSDVTKHLVKEIFFDYTQMSYKKNAPEYKLYQHGSPTKDRRKEMADILNSYMLNPTEAEHGGAIGVGIPGYWDKFEEALNRNIYNWIDKECKKKGLEVKKVG